MEQAAEIGPGLFAFRVDEGADHWVIAVDAEDAKRVVLDDQYGGEPHDAWHEVEALPESTARLQSLTFHDDDGAERTMLHEMQRDPRRRYVACSEI